MTRLSPLQYGLLKKINSEWVTLQQMKHYDQRALRSLLIREFVYFSGNMFKLTEKGFGAIEDFRRFKITRKNPEAPLTKYFDERFYKLRKANHA